jgi:hypothetical protein
MQCLQKISGPDAQGLSRGMGSARLPGEMKGRHFRAEQHLAGPEAKFGLATFELNGARGEQRHAGGCTRKLSEPGRFH